MGEGLWTVVALGAAGFGLGLGLALGTWVAGRLRREMDDDDRKEDDR